MNGIEQESQCFQHMAARMNRELRVLLARTRRVEQHQTTLINWLLGPDHSSLEITIGYEQTAIKITAAVAQREPDPYLAQIYRFGMLEDFYHLYRYSALLDRVEGKDANNILQSYTDILPGRPTMLEHRAPEDDVREPYDIKISGADHQVAGTDDCRDRTPSQTVLSDSWSAVCRPGGAPALSRNLFDRKTTCDPV